MGGVLDDRLDSQGVDASVDPYPDSDIDATGETDLYGKLYYALFQNHLAELVATLAFECDADESACWKTIADVARDAFADIRTDPDVPSSRVERDENSLFESTMSHKALTAMRLQGKRHEYVTSTIPNPLAQHE